MVIKRSVGDYIFDILNHCFLALLTLATLYPFLHVVFASFSEPAQLAQHRGIMFGPRGFSLEAYKAVFKNPMIASGYRNTIIVVVSSVLLSLVMTSMGAYVLTRKDFFWKKPLTMMIVFTMFFSGGLIPTFMLVRGLGMINTLWSLIIPGCVGAYNMFVMRTSFQSIPDSLFESARIDGANEFYILFRIVLPLSIPIIAVMSLRFGVANWNGWFSAMIYLRKRELWPLQLVLREIVAQNNTNSMMEGMGGTSGSADDRYIIEQTLKYATIMVATFPILCVYPFLQKYFVKGVMIGAIKG